MPTLAALYARISNELLQTGEDKVSIETQLADCRAYAHARGLVVAAEYVDDVRYRDAKGVLVDPAGWRADRPQWLRMLAGADRGEFQAIVAWHSTRLFRSYTPMAQLVDIAERHKLKVECVKDSFNVDLAPIYAWAAKQERQAFAARSAMGKVGRARRGLPTTRAPAHYQKITDSSGATVAYHLRDEARPWLAEIARRYLDGQGLNQIARALVRHPITGTRLSPRAVNDVLERPFNYGIIAAYRYSASGPVGEFAGTHEPCWDAATCAALQAELSRRRHPKSARLRGTGIFSGIVRCGICGRLLSITSNGRKPHIYQQYLCWHAKAYKSHPSVSILEPKLIRLVQRALAAVTDDELAAVVERLTFAPTMTADMLTTLEQQRAEILERIAALESDLSAVRSPAARQAVAGQLADAQAEYESVSEQLARAGQGGGPADKAELLRRVRVLRDSPDIWHLPFPQLRATLMRSIPALYVLKGALAPAPTVNQE